MVNSTIRLLGATNLLSKDGKLGKNSMCRSTYVLPVANVMQCKHFKYA